MRWTVGTATSALAVIVLAACTGTTSGSSSDNGVGAPVHGSVTGMAADAGSGADATSAGGTSSGGAALRPATEAAATRVTPQLILTGSLSVVVRSVDRSAARAESIAAGTGGRTDADYQDSPRGSRPTAELTLRVPNPAVPAVLNRLAALGRQTDRHLSTRDVTTEVADVTSRVASARSAIASLRALYTKAADVGDVIRIEASLSQREASLESLEARQRSLSRQVALATITLDLTQRKAAAAPPVKHSQRSGFVGGLERGWHAFTAVVGALAVALGAALPFLLVALVLALVGIAVRRRLRPRSVLEAGSE